MTEALETAPFTPHTNEEPPRRWATLLGLWMLSMTGLVAGVIAIVQNAHLSRIYDSVEAAPTGTVAIVLGAGVRPNGRPSDALKDRLDRAVQLYQAGRVQAILVTGDDGGYRVDEISVMTKYLLQHDIPTSTLRIDGKGYRTYESCKHAAEQGIRDAIVVTQRFHMSRALYLCHRLGVDSIGVTSDLQTYEDITFFWIRDFAASFKAWVDVNLFPPPSPA